MKKNYKLWAVINNAGVTHRANEAFATDSNLEVIAANFVHFITPQLFVEGGSLAEMTLTKAFQAFVDSEHGDKARSFVETIVASVDSLVRIRISVQDCDGLWMIWSYNEPLQDLLDKHKTEVLQIKSRAIFAPRTPLLVKMLAAISTAEYMGMAQLDFQRMFAHEAAAA